MATSKYDAEYIAHTVRLVYGVKKATAKIRRVNINAAPLKEGYIAVRGWYRNISGFQEHTIPKRTNGTT